MTIEFTPKQLEAFEALQSEKYNFILYGGAIRGGKTFWGLCSLLVLCEVFPGSRWCVVRENTERIRTTTIPSFSKIGSRGKLRQNPFEYKHHNGSIIMFKGENIDRDPDLDSFKGLEVNGFLFEEINECQEKTLSKAFERAGSWIIPNAKYQPYPVVLATCNPTNGWVKDRVYTPWKEKRLPAKWIYVPAKITDNPHLTQDYIDNLENLTQYEYMVFVEGDWEVQLKTGGEFFKGFELGKHVKPTRFNTDEVIHVSIDSNVDPHIAVTLWQMKRDANNVWQVKQVAELPAEDPDNTAKRAGAKVANYLKNSGYNGSVFMYGDRSTKSRNNIDDDKRSFYEIFTTELKNAGFRIEDKFLSLAPSVAAIADFVNAIFDGTLKFAEITIGEHCKKSINDYILTKQDRDGTMLKKRVTNPATGVSYEPNGHLCFVGETMVLTHDGEKRIDEIQVGDYVLTRKGYKKVINHFKNGIQEVKTYKIGNISITCTPNHKFWTKENDFEQINKLIGLKTFCIFVKNTICKKKLFITEELLLQGIQKQKQGQNEFITQEELLLTANQKRLDYTFTNGCVKLVKYLTNTLFITKMKILLTMNFQILNVSKVKNTCQQTKENKKVMLLWKLLLVQRLLNGINLKFLHHGIKNTLKTLFLKLKLQQNVKNVELSLQPKLKEGKAKSIFAAQNINGNIKQELQGPENQKLEFALLVESKLMDKNIVHSNATQAEVFNIEVEEVHEYFANGILVSNCDTLKDFIVQAFKDEFDKFQNRFNVPKPGAAKTVSRTPRVTL